MKGQFMKKSIYLFSKCLSLLLVFVVLFGLFGCKDKKAKVTVTIEGNKEVIATYEKAPFRLNVNGASQDDFFFNVSNPDLIEVQYDEEIMNYVVVSKKAVPTNTEVSVNAVCKSDNTISASKKFSLVAPTFALDVDKNQAVKGDVITITPSFTGFGKDAPAVTYKTTNPNVKITGNTVKVLEKTTSEEKVTVTGTTSIDGVEFTATTEITLLAQSILNVTLKFENNMTRISEKEDLQCLVEVTGTDNKEVVWSFASQGATDILAIDTDTNILAVVKAVSTDTLVTITVRLASDPTISASKTITVLASENAGSVRDLSSDMLKELGNKSLTINGILTDYYKDYNASYNSHDTSYQMKVEMEEGAWSGEWYPVGREESKIKNVYRKSTVEGVASIATLDGQMRVEGHELNEIYINKNNEVVCAPVVDYRSVPSLWEVQHLWNHFGDLQISKFVYNQKDDVYEYRYDKSNYDDLYLMTYFSFSLTPLLSDTLDSVYLTVVDGQITKLYAETEHLLYGDGEDPDAMSYTSIELTFENVGTTTVSDPTPFEKPQFADYLEQALSEMKTTPSYTFRAVDNQTAMPSYDEGEYEIDINASADNNPLAVMRMLKTVKNYTSATGTVGLRGEITEDAALFEETGKYSNTMDGKAYHVTYTGYKQVSENTYDAFEYRSSVDTLVGYRQFSGNFKDLLPGFDFSSAIFEYKGNSQGTNPQITNYTFVLREKRIYRDVALEVCASSLAKDAEADVSTQFTIVVNNLGHLVSTSFPYSIVGGAYAGVVTTSYQKVGETTFDADVFAGYVARVPEASWDEFECKYYHPTHSTQVTVAATAGAVINSIFGDAAASFPSPAIFRSIFGDIIYGPFFDWKEYENGDSVEYIDYLSINTEVFEYDANYMVSKTQYEALVEKMTEVFASIGYIVSKSNTDISGGEYGTSDTYITFTNGEILIVINNNHTKNFFIHMYKTGDWSLNS